MQLKTRQIVVTLIWSVFVASVLTATATAYISFGSPTLLPPLVYKLFGEVMSSYAAFHGELHVDD